MDMSENGGFEILDLHQAMAIEQEGCSSLSQKCKKYQAIIRINEGNTDLMALWPRLGKDK